MPDERPCLHFGTRVPAPLTAGVRPIATHELVGDTETRMVGVVAVSIEGVRVAVHWCGALCRLKFDALGACPRHGLGYAGGLGLLVLLAGFHGRIPYPEVLGP